MRKILIVDDIPGVRTQIAVELRTLDVEIEEAANGAEALEKIQAARIDLVISDVQMPRMNGIELLRALRELHIPVILHSGYPDIDTAVEAVKLGAIDFFPAPIDFVRLRARVEHSLTASTDIADTLLGISEQSQGLRNLIHAFAGRTEPILITGETGVGKEVVARSIHTQSGGSNNNFVVVQCGTVNNRSVGPDGTWQGLWAQATDGTLLLDEISDSSHEFQTELCRTIDTLPETGPRTRLIATTRKDIVAEVAGGSFRDDLWYRISTLQIHVPRLRDRVKDIRGLADAELTRLSNEHGGVPLELDESGYHALEHAAWDGNVRELQTVIRRMVVVGGERRLFDDYDIKQALRTIRIDERPRTSYERRERDELRRALEDNDWNVSATARTLGKERGWLRRRMEKLGLD